MGIARQIASDLRVSESVLMPNYVKETDDEMRQRSNRTYRRNLASLSSEVATRYGVRRQLFFPLNDN